MSTLSEFWEKNKVVIYVVGALVVLWFINDWRDTNRALRAQEALQATLNQQYELINGVAKAQNLLMEDGKKRDLTQDAFGKAFAETMANQNRVLLALSQSIGRVEGSVTTGAVSNQTTSGTVSQADMVQDRGGKPSLTSAHVLVDTRNAGNPVWSVQWKNNPELFKVNFGLFKKGSTAGELTAYTTLSREVSKDGVSLGKEEIQLGESTMKLDPSFITNTNGAAKLDIPRLGFFLGAGWDPNKCKWTPAGGADYRMTDRLSVMGGYVNNGPFVGGRFNFNLK